jgi:hypothetical protein
MRIHAYASRMTALLFAGLAPTAAYFALTGDVRLIPFVFVIALGHAVILGLPAFLLGRSLGRVNLISSGVVGFIIGACPIALLMLPLWLGSNSSASIDAVPTISNGFPTLAGWLYYLLSLASFGALGALGGIAFLVILKLAGDTVRTDDDAASPIPRRTTWATSSLATVAILLTGTALAIPSVTMDRTCHNMFRDGRTSVGTKVNVRLSIPVEGWPQLTRLFEEFGAANNLSFRNSNLDRPGTVQVLGLSLCNEGGLNIHAIQQHWERAGNSVPEKDGVSLNIYEVRDGSNWTHDARKLIAELETRWPGKVQFKDGRGRIIPMPDELREAH